MIQNGTSGFDHFTGSNGNDQLYSNGGNDYLSPGEGHDTMYLNGVGSVFAEGGLGNDRFVIWNVSGVVGEAPFQGWADSGNVLLGGGGADLYDFGLAAAGYTGDTTIVDFNRGGGDTVILPNIGRVFNIPWTNGWHTSYDAGSNTTTLQAMAGGGEIHFIGNTPQQVWSGIYVI